jgi:hypothetical protein
MSEQKRAEEDYRQKVSCWWESILRKNDYIENTVYGPNNKCNHLWVQIHPPGLSKENCHIQCLKCKKCYWMDRDYLTYLNKKET